MADAPTPDPDVVPVPDVSDEAFVTAVAKATGNKQVIPREWLALSDAGVPGFDFELPPSTRGRAAKNKES
jgi:hypothetical protein